MTWCLRIGLLVLWSAMALPGMAAASDAWLARASSEHPGGFKASLAVDGKRDTRWASQGDGLQRLDIDFGRPVPVTRAVIRWEAAYATAYALLVSDDGKAWRSAAERKDGKGGVETVGGFAATGRYLRVECRAAGPHKLYSIWELEFPEAEPARALQARAAERAARAGEPKRKLLAALKEAGARAIVFALRKPVGDGHWYANFGYYAECENPRGVPGSARVGDRNVAYRPGGRLCRLDLDTGRVVNLLDDPEGGVRDPFVEADGRTILFSYRQGTNANYHLYTIRSDGTELRQLTDGPYDDIEPCRLPDGDILFVSSRCKRWVNCWVTQVATLHRGRADGSEVQAISSNNEHDNTPWVLPDGRVIYTRWEYVDRSQVDYHHLWAANPDGTAQTVYFGNQRPGLLMIDTKPIPGGNRVVSIFSPGHGMRDHAGALAVVDPGHGPDDQGRARVVNAEHVFRDPWAFSEDCFLAARGTEIVAVDGEGSVAAVHALPPEDVKADFLLHEPRPLMGHAPAPAIPGRTQPEKDTGRLILANLYEGRNLAGLKKGDVRKLLVLESLPKPINFTGGMDPLTYGGSFTLERVLGTAPVEADGSAYLEVPALRSLILVALDERDLAVKRMQSFLTVQPGETTSCVGCHEPRTRTLIPDHSLLALRRPPSRLAPAKDCPDVFDYPRDIQPVLDRLCADCHGYEPTPRGGPCAGKVVLTGDRGPMFSHSYFTMTMRQLFADGRNEPKSNYAPRELGSGASRIFKMIDGSHHDAKATPRERDVLRLWIDAGAPYIGTYAGLGSGMVGGYAQNQPTHVDTDWPATKAAAAVLDRRCVACHKAGDARGLPRSLSDERGLSFWRFDLKDPRHASSRHIVFNLSRPEKSLLLLAPLAPAAGGLGLCRNTNGPPAAVFAGTDDADYRALLAMVAAGRDYLNRITRFDRPDFIPRPEYLREMKRFGILPADFNASTTPVNVYELDRRYWESLWYRPPATQARAAAGRPPEG